MGTREDPSDHSERDAGRAERLASLRTRVHAAERAAARLEGEAQAATRDADAAVRRLAELGVTGATHKAIMARAMIVIAEAERQLTDAMAAAERAVADAEAAAGGGA